MSLSAAGYAFCIRLISIALDYPGMCAFCHQFALSPTRLPNPLQCHNLFAHPLTALLPPHTLSLHVSVFLILPRLPAKCATVEPIHCFYFTSLLQTVSGYTNHVAAGENTFNFDFNL